MPEKKKRTLFCDESSQSNARFMVIGGVITPFENVEIISEHINQKKSDLGLNSEVKWTKITNQKQREYQELTNYFFSLCNNDKLHFKCIIIDNHRIDNRQYNAGNRELGFFKFYYQLLLHSFGRWYSDECELHVLLDQKSTNQSLDDFREILNNGIASRYSISSRPYKQVEFRDSKLTPILQLNDLVIGAIAHRKNGLHNLSECRESKKLISQQVIEMAGVAEDLRTTPKASKRFAIWNFSMR